MKSEILKMKYKGQYYEGEVGIPEDLKEAYLTLSEQEIYEDFLRGYKARMREVVAGIRKRKRSVIKINLAELSDSQIEQLRRAGLLGA